MTRAQCGACAPLAWLTLLFVADTIGCAASRHVNDNLRATSGFPVQGGFSQPVRSLPPLPCGVAANQHGGLTRRALTPRDLIEQWKVSTWRSQNREHKTGNVVLTPGRLRLRVDGNIPPRLPTIGGEISSPIASPSRGALCVQLKATGRHGTVTGVFFYGNDQNEIDIELLSGESAQGRVHFSVHRATPPLHSHDVVDLEFDPSGSFHTYAFQWSDAQVEFFVDGRLVAVSPAANLTLPGRFMINHWSGRFPKWGGGPPDGDAWLDIQRVVTWSEPTPTVAPTRPSTRPQ